MSFGFIDDNYIPEFLKMVESREEGVSFQICETSTTKNGMGNRANMISSVLVEEQQPTKKSFQIKKN
ncbi:hypothetical protein Avbf_13086 [Armadillidium vulgare]|nr:hypothetical protein Avbf_13086 [Armadillidium vulgare]